MYIYQWHESPATEKVYGKTITEVSKQYRSRMEMRE